MLRGQAYKNPEDHSRAKVGLGLVKNRPKSRKNYIVIVVNDTGSDIMDSGALQRPGSHQVSQSLPLSLPCGVYLQPF